MTENENAGNIAVLIIDDDKKLCRLVAEYLEPMGYKVTAAYDGKSGLEKALSGDVDVVILDVMMPEMDGFEVLKKLRKQSDIPVLMLTALGEETDRIVGLEMGADDYLPKTFSTRELLARLRAVTRRSFQAKEKRERQAIEPALVFGALRIEPASRMVFMNDAALELTPIEYGLLVALAGSAGRVLTRDQLLDDVAGRDYEVFDRSIDVHISSLRKKLGDDPKNPHYIKTVRSTGYMFLDEGIR